MTTAPERIPHVWQQHLWGETCIGCGVLKSTARSEWCNGPPKLSDKAKEHDRGRWDRLVRLVRTKDEARKRMREERAKEIP